MNRTIEKIRRAGEGMFIERTFFNEIEIAAWLESQGYKVVATELRCGLDRALARTACGMTVCANGYTYAAGGDRCDAWRPAPTARHTQPQRRHDGQQVGTASGTPYGIVGGFAVEPIA